MEIPGKLHHSIRCYRSNRYFFCLLITVAAPLSVYPQQPVTIQAALTDRFDDFTAHACQIVPWVSVKQSDAMKSGAKGQKGPDVIPQIFRQPWDMNAPVAARVKGVTLAGVTEKVYTEAETKDQTTFIQDDTLNVLNGTSTVPSITQAIAYHDLSFYSHSCSYLIKLGMSVKGGLTLPFAALQAALGGTTNPQGNASMVMIGGTFPSRLYALLHDSPANQLYAAAFLWDWYTQQSQERLSGKLFYRQSVRGFAATIDNGQENQTSGNLSANASLNFVAVNATGSVQATLSSQENIYSRSFNVILLPGDTDFVPLPDANALSEIFKANPTKRPADTTGQAKFDINYNFAVVQQSEGLPAKVCQGTWQFVPGSGNQVKLITSGIIPLSTGADSKPICTFSFAISLDNPGNFSQSAKLQGTLQFTDIKSNRTIVLPISDMDIYLPDRPSPTQVSVTPIPKVDPATWPPDPAMHNLQYQLTVPFDDKGGSLDWSASSQSFSPGKPTLTCTDKASRDGASWVTINGGNGVTVNKEAKSVQLLLGYSYYPAFGALDIYSGDWRSAPQCTVSFTLKAPQTGQSSLPLVFPIDSAKIGNGLLLYFPKLLSQPQIKVVLAAGAAATTSLNSPVALPDGFVSTSYGSQASTVKLLVTGGLGPYTWTWAGDPYPAGLDALKVNDSDKFGSLVPITGTPVEATNYVFSAQVTDRALQTATQLLSMNINQALGITTTQLQGGTVGVKYQARLAASGGTPGYHWKLILPQGPQVSLADDGTITFLPTAAGTTTILVEVSDSAKPAHTQKSSFDIAVANP